MNTGNHAHITNTRQARTAMRSGQWTIPTVYQLPGYVQANLAIVPKSIAYDLLVYCQRNRSACPVLEITDPGDPIIRQLADNADIRTDLPKYNVYRNGELTEQREDITDLWRDDLVAFLIGSSLTFDEPLRRAGVNLSPQVWVYRTNIPTTPSGSLHGSLIVTMRVMTPSDAIVATQLTSRFPFNHGSPVHVGDPALIGINTSQPMFGEPLESISPEYIAVYWACGVTPQQVAIDARLPLMITHAPGHAFITDMTADRICLP